MFLALAVCLILVVGFLVYNSVIGKKNQVDNAMGGLDAQLKQRYDLVPNLVSCVKTYMQHEASTLEKIVEHREGKNKQEMNKELSSSLSGIIVRAEQYPELKASANFQQLQNSLLDIEQNIAASRRFFNAAVTDYNNALEMFPSNIVCRMLNLQRKEVFNIPEIERKNVSVQNLFDGKAS
jgi:LemA protein